MRCICGRSRELVGVLGFRGDDEARGGSRLVRSGYGGSGDVFVGRAERKGGGEVLALSFVGDGSGSSGRVVDESERVIWGFVAVLVGEPDRNGSGEPDVGRRRWRGGMERRFICLVAARMEESKTVETDEWLGKTK